MKNENMGVEELYLAPEETKESDMIFPADSFGNETSEIHFNDQTSKKPKHINRIEEIPEQRGVNFKVFRMSDGSEQAVFSPCAIHVFDNETHTFENVESTIIEDEDGRHFTCGKNHFIAKFSAEEDTDDIFSIENGMHKVTVLSRKNKKNKNKGVRPKIGKKEREGVLSRDILTFAEIGPSTDYEYSVDGSGVKENIVIKKPSDIYRYPFILRCENITAKFDEGEKRISFLSNESGDEVFFIPAPFMTDANGITSTAVNFDVKTKDSDLILLTVTADSDWINSPKRAFPVTIDPQINISSPANMSTYSWDNGNLYNTSLHTIGTVATNSTYAASAICESDCSDNSSNSTNNTISAATISLNTWYKGYIDCPYDEIWYKFVANAKEAHPNGKTGKYTIYTNGSLDTMGYLYDSNRNLIASNDDGCNTLNFCLSHNLTYGATYYLKVKAWSNKTGNYNIIVAPSTDKIEPSPTCFNVKRMYMRFAMPTLPRNPRIKKAELQVFQASSVSEYGSYPMFGLYHVTDELCAGACTPINDSNLIDFARMRVGHCEDGEVISYTFDITTLIDKVNKGESQYPSLVLKMLDESITSQNNITLYGSSHGGNYTPRIVITYESSYGVNTSYRTNTHELGRFGQGSVDLQCGNLMFESEDFAWSGNRMPVTIKHLFNSALAGYNYSYNNSIKLATAAFSGMKIGRGFKLNLMQSIITTSFVHEGVSYSGYVYIGENGEETYFKKSEKEAYNSNTSQYYKLYEDIDSSDILYDPIKRTLKQGDDTYLFDASGRLIRITDAANNHMDITYTSNRITSVTDGAGREFGFIYNSNGQLTSITAPDGTYITYGYTSDLLTSVSYPDNKKAKIVYSSDKPVSVTLEDANGAQVYKVAYTFIGDRLASVTEYGSDNSVGAMSSYSYSVASGRTLVTTTEPRDADEGETADNVITTTYTFDDDGNIVSEYAYSKDTGNVGVTCGGSGINPINDSEYTSNINNLLTGHNFESLSTWHGEECNCSDMAIGIVYDDINSKFGSSAMRIESCNSDCINNGVYQSTNTLPAGEYTFSSYVRVVSPIEGDENRGAYLRVTDTRGNVLSESEKLIYEDSDYVRLHTSFSLNTDQSVIVHILINGKGIIYADAAQLENNPFVNRYNMLENGNFENDLAGWNNSYGVHISTQTRFNMKKSLMMLGDVNYSRFASQNVKVKSAVGTLETFTLSGWAAGYGLPNHERIDIPTPKFELRAVIYYKDNSTQTVTAPFSPCTADWQFVSVEVAKTSYKEISRIHVCCDYSNNTGSAFFDDIQFVRNSIETNLSKTDIEGDETDAGGSTTETNTPTFSEALDAYGNALTETTFTQGQIGAIYRSFAYNTDDFDMSGDNSGNDLIRETDARGNKTYYTVDGDTSRNEEVTDRCGNKTAYEYDASGRTTKVTSKNAEGTELANVSYAYDSFDNMTEIVRGDGMKYALAYNEFHNLESIGIEGKDEALIKYTYKNGNGRLKEMKYANGDTMKAAYNSFGQMVAETWFDKNGVETARYKYVYDGEGNIVRSIDIRAKKEYNYEYEEGRIVRAVESDIVLSGELVTGRTLVHTVRYYYDSEAKLTKKVIISSDGNAFTYNYTNSESSTVAQFSAGGRTVTSQSNTDHLGRKTFDEIQLGTATLSRQFSYHEGEVTDEHIANGKQTSSATTQLISKITLSDGRTISYEYDAEERISKVIDSLDGTTEYTYDALGQLLTETVNGEVVNSMEYDNYGNIIKKNGKAYTYGDATWKDLLTGFDGKTIEYDAQGNPVKYLGHNLTWEKGRQLKKFDDIEYTYNANGIRTSKTVGGVKHTYTLDGTKILRETWGENTLVPLYDNEDSACGILYNNVPYYFIKNLQGDIIAIVDKDAQTVARYSYDAWGVVTNAVTYTELTNGVDVATINPFRYRGYYYDEEIELYYLQSRYYDAGIRRFINGDSAEILGMAIVSNIILDINLFTYCSNRITNDIDITGYISAESIAKSISTTAIFNMFVSMLYTNTSKALTSISVYVTKIITPIAVKAFWWKPIFAAAIVVAAVAIVVGLVSLHFSKKSKGKTKLPSKLKSGNKVKTPDSHKSEFKQKKGGSYSHNKTGWEFKKAKDGHYRGEHWHAYPKNAKTGDYYNISPEGNVLS